MVQPAIFVRKVSAADIKYASEATKVVNAAYRSGDGWTSEKDIVDGLRCKEEDMKKFIEENGKVNTLLYGFEEEAVVGTVQIQHHNSEEAEIGLFSVSPAYQSRGIGGRLIRSAMSELKELGYTRALLHVLENRLDILAWYKKLGFQETGERIPFIFPNMLKSNYKDLHFLTLKKTV